MGNHIWQMVGETICFFVALRGMSLKDTEQTTNTVKATNTMAAGVGISNKEFIIVLYDCDLDILMVSDHVPVRTSTEGGACQ